MADKKKSKLTYARIMSIAGTIGVTLFCVAHLVYTFPTKLGEIEPTWVLTPLYILPVLTGLWVTKRIGIPGLIFLTFAVTGAHYLAQTLGIMTFSLFTGNKSDSELPFVVVGAVAGAIGAAVSFIGFSLLGRDLRNKICLMIYLRGTFGMAVIGALCFFSMMLIEPLSNKWIFQLYLPWQIAFNFMISWIFSIRKA